jgi:glyoxylase-like metal-dependent hydrolase (beta-lactamase superfamily II)/predicted ester cyclase
MATTSETARRYFQALSAHDLDAAMSCWAPDGNGRFVNDQELVAHDGIRDYFARVFAAFPDFKLTILEMTTARNRTVVRWRAEGTFAGPASFEGLKPSGARVEFEGCDVVTVQDGLIRRNEAFVDRGALARQLGLLPPLRSKSERRLIKLANLRTWVAGKARGAEVERIADGVWVIRGGPPAKVMNVYMIKDGDGVTVFDAGSAAMGLAVAAAGARRGGIKRVVLGHADADHRGAAPVLAAPVLCHENERSAAESPDSYRDYWDMTKLDVHGRTLLGRLIPVWDGGPAKIADTVKEGDRVAGFRVIDLPGHAPGQVGLFRDSDRLALATDCLYTLDVQTGRKVSPRVPHPAFNLDTEQARESIRKLAALSPSAVWAGHADPVTGDVVSQLQQAAAAPV